MGFHGLRTQETVARYRGIWQQAIDDGFAMPVHPGDLVNLPGAEVHPFPAFTAHHRYDVTDKDGFARRRRSRTSGKPWCSTWPAT